MLIYFFRGLVTLFLCSSLQIVFAQIYLRLDSLHLNYVSGLNPEFRLLYFEKDQHSFIQNERIHYANEPQKIEAHFRRHQTEHYPIIQEDKLRYEAINYYYLGECELRYRPQELGSRDIGKIELRLVSILELDLKEAQISLKSGHRDSCIFGLSYYELSLPSKNNRSVIAGLTLYTPNFLGHLYDTMTFRETTVSSLSLPFGQQNQAQSFLKKLRERQQILERQNRNGRHRKQNRHYFRA